MLDSRLVRLGSRFVLVSAASCFVFTEGESTDWIWTFLYRNRLKYPSVVLYYWCLLFSCISYYIIRILWMCIQYSRNWYLWHIKKRIKKIATKLWCVWQTVPSQAHLPVLPKQFFIYTYSTLCLNSNIVIHPYFPADGWFLALVSEQAHIDTLCSPPQTTALLSLSLSHILPIVPLPHPSLLTHPSSPYT